MPTLTIRTRLVPGEATLPRLDFAGGHNPVNGRPEVGIGDLLLIKRQRGLRRAYRRLRLLNRCLRGQYVIAAQLNVLLIGNSRIEIRLLLLELGQRRGNIFLLVAFHRQR